MKVDDLNMKFKCMNENFDQNLNKKSFPKVSFLLYILLSKIKLFHDKTGLLILLLQYLQDNYTVTVHKAVHR